MASKAFINTMATLAIAESQLKVLFEKLEGDQLEACKPVLTSAATAINDAYWRWPGKLDKKAMDRLKKILDRFHAIAEPTDISEFTSVALALLHALRGYITDSVRAAALDRVIETFFLVHKFFDPDLNKKDEYRNADKMAQYWAELVEAA